MTKYWFVIVLVSLSFLITYPLFEPGYFLHHDDLQVMRIFEMHRCFEDLQLPCRWVPDMGYGFGYPLFNFYSAFPYYIGGGLSFFLGYIGAAKVLFFIPLFFGYLFMYLLGKELFGRKVGFVVATIYAFAPYRALDSYVRGAIAESFALMLFPLILFFGYRLTKNTTQINFTGAALSLAALLTTHNIMSLFFIPVYTLFLVLLLFFNRGKYLKEVVGSVVLGIGISAFFVVPAFFEKSLVQIDTLLSGGSNFRAHFISLYQLFWDRFWGYGQSVFGPKDTLSFQIGWPHWWLVVLAILSIMLFAISLKIKRLKQVSDYIFNIPAPKFLVLELFFIAVFVFSIFMTHYRSAFIWEPLEILHFAQFPWRFLSITILSSSLIAGFFLVSIKKGQNLLLIIISILVVVINFNYFQPGEFYFNVTDKEKLSGDLWDIQQKAGILDYLPKTAYEPKEPAPDQPLVSTSSAIITNFNNNSNRFSFSINTKEKTEVVVPVFEFPIWQIKINEKIIEHKYNSAGLITFTIDPGRYHIVGEFKDTGIRKFANITSVVSLLILIIISRRFTKQ